MKKLYHPNSCNAKTQESNKKSSESADLLIQTDIGGSADSTAIRSLEGKILVMEERNKSIQAFYQNKIAQLRQVLSKQGETKSDLMQELAALSTQNQQQSKYVSQLKNQIEGENKGDRTALKQSQKLRNQTDFKGQGNEGRFNSRSRGKNLFSSRNFGKESTRIPLKKAKSSQFLESEDFLREETSTDGRKKVQRTMKSISWR